MNADLKGCLNKLDKVYKVLEHKGRPLYKEQVKKILEYGINKGYETLYDIPDSEIDNLLTPNP